MQQNHLPRLDLLIYAHDGRGLGHVSRSAAIGMAFRRLFPDMKVLLATGSTGVSGLIHPAPLDWIKLPAYATRVVNGVSRGCPGPSNFSDADLGRFRARTLEMLIRLYRPCCILADHMPQGKHKELIPALEASSAETGTAWVLGMRGITGDVPNTAAGKAVSLFRKYYTHILWYGDARVLGKSHKTDLHRRFGVEPHETGYVSRFAELKYWREPAGKKPGGVAAAVSIPWVGEHSLFLMRNLYAAIAEIGDRFGCFHVFFDGGGPQPSWKEILAKFQNLPHCVLKPVGHTYFDTLEQSRAALIYGGYNSLTDVLYAGIPGVVILRGMKDGEQEAHIRLLVENGKIELMSVTEKQATAEWLRQALIKQLTAKANPDPAIRLDGAENAARRLSEIISGR